MEPKISVIVPVYKVEDCLDKCVRSLLSQTDTDLEIILVDDGSPDNSPQMCDAWAEKDSRIKVIHKENGGASTARNRGLEVATGDYFGFVDSDDFIHPMMFEKMMNALLNSTKKVAYCYFNRYRDGQIVPTTTPDPREILDTKTALDLSFYGKIDYAVWSKLYRRDFFDSIRFSEHEVHEDSLLLIPAIVYSEGLACVPEALYTYRNTEGSVVHSIWTNDTGVVLKHLYQMIEQLKEIQMKDLPSFKIFLGKTCFSSALSLDKNYERLDNTAKQNQRKYISIMRKLWWPILMSKYVTKKDKVLYSMVASRTLRPIYKILGKK
jgi:glycosyltransferase involved in cell wall biosynthesis